jgi:hypothetical protein
MAERVHAVVPAPRVFSQRRPPMLVTGPRLSVLRFLSNSSGASLVVIYLSTTTSLTGALVRFGCSWLPQPMDPLRALSGLAAFLLNSPFRSPAPLLLGGLLPALGTWQATVLCGLVQRDGELGSPSILKVCYPAASTQRCCSTG